MTRSDPLVIIPALELHGRRALARLGARLAGLYLLGVVVGVAAAAAGERGAASAGLPVAGQVLVLGLIACFALDRASAISGARSVPAVLRLLALGAGLAVLARIVSAAALIGWPQVHVLAGWVVPGLGLGLALAGGPGWGSAGFAVLGVEFVLIMTPDAFAAVLTTLGGAAVPVVVGCVVHVFARRGFRLTEIATRAAESADAARRSAEQRLLARRRVDRMLHDTVLSTLTVLAHGGRGVLPDQVRADCRRDLTALRSERWSVTEARSTEWDEVVGHSPALPGDTGLEAPLGLLPRQCRPIAERLDAVRELAARRGIDLRVHVQAENHALGTERQDAAMLEAWSSALAECVTNITRHAGVAAADVVLGRTDSALITLVVDEGSGFEPSSVRPERLGLSGSVRDRLHDVGGQARVWSRPGEGTVVELVLPWPRAGGEAGR